ncbi:hypothetical protein M378DRAFT_171912 [Amanita muscaria Koide BX008]|uniref:Uncharacterized protein n=1 Tax=Amanita muscaria (strain Koide BX008) TaxID=946122 RepID=A0A0C2WKV4_AMAMK|nr:hypothetical protein M378DRAFT_171912 [Amanita muscaria Koide BX008]
MDTILLKEDVIRALRHHLRFSSPVPLSQCGQGICLSSYYQIEAARDTMLQRGVSICLVL